MTSTLRPDASNMTMFTNRTKMHTRTVSPRLREEVRNMTGLFLGRVDIHQSEPSRTVIPPLSRKKISSMRRAQTPTERTRYRKIEQLRLGPSEDRRGFSAKPVLRMKRDNSEQAEQHYASPSSVSIDVNRPTSRHFMAIPNSGVSRLEPLHPTQGGAKGDQDNSVIEALKREATFSPNGQQQQHLVGLTDTYQNICNGRPDVLHSLVSNKSGRKSHKRFETKYTYTGFAIKSYRNPKSAEIMADFSSSHPPPKDSSKHLSNIQVHPHGLPVNFKLSQSRTLLTSRLYEFTGSPKTPKKRSQAGAGAEVSGGQGHSTSATRADCKQPMSARQIDTAAVPRNTPALTGDFESEGGTEGHISLPRVDVQSTVTETASVPELSVTSLSRPNAAVTGNTRPEINSSDNKENEEMETRKEVVPSPIVLEVEDESGAFHRVNIDNEQWKEQSNEEVESERAERDEEHKSKEEEMILMAKNAESRQKELMQLLNEHAQLVQKMAHSSDEEEEMPTSNLKQEISTIEAK